ncbi:T-cell differentiation antigen CD6 [Pelobates cultripes]|uniref:T-cell differentiation antigen CD6 n=1 Tax=Pelobates cultripes TaxID=61616 RepID=A0AAD1S7A5_PELCU|nr:T-cell differentiation antigen CD6 [Pelobates cultripes]CAH2286335.1 T-cell differentiation antigen CD6 [Pelobates cultripes]
MAGYSISYLTLWIYILIPVKTGSHPIQLFGGGSRCQGIVQILRKDVWMPVCNRFWNDTLTAMVCKELNCGNPTGSAVNGETTLSVNTTFLRVTCPDTDLLKACNISFVTEAYCRRPVVINCTDHKAVRVSGGADNCSGRVEVFTDGVWGTVCEDHWFEDEFAMLCNTLGCGSFVRKTCHNHSLSTYTSFICKDTSSLWNCSIYHKNHNICKESKALGVVCKGSLETETSIPTKTSIITTASTAGKMKSIKCTELFSEVKVAGNSKLKEQYSFRNSKLYS